MIVTGIFLYPIIEIIAFFLVARATSWSTVLFLTLCTSLLGVALFRRRRFGFGADDFTARSLENYLFGNLGAFALIMPGFVSDVFGLILLIPPLRRALLSFVRFCGFDSSRSSVGNFSFLRAFSFGDHNQDHYQNACDSSRFDDSCDETIDVESYDPREKSERTRADDASPANDSDVIDVDFVVRH